MTTRFTFTRVLLYLVLTFACTFYLLPFFVMVITSLKPYADLNVTRMWELPKSIGLDGFIEGWKAVAPNFRNSAVITIPTALLSSILGSMNGYIFAKWRFPESDLIFILFLVGMFLPYQGVLIPLVRTLQKFHALWQSVGADFGTHHLWHPNHGHALSWLLCWHSRRVGRCGQDGWL